MAKNSDINLLQYADPSILAPYIDRGVVKQQQALGKKLKSTYQPIDLSAIPFSGSQKKDEKSNLSSILDILGSAGGAVTNQIANWTDPNLDWRDIPLAEAGSQFGEGFSKTLQENPWGVLYGAPLWGGLENVGEKSKRSEEIFSNIFGEQQAADQPYTAGSFFKGQKGALDLRDIGEFTTDVLLDPLTYLTFGAGSAVKAGAKAAQQSAKQAAKTEGVTLGKMKDVYTEAPAQIEQKLLQQGRSAEEAAQAAKKAQQTIQNSAKAARAKAQNAIISLDVPFTKLTKQFGQKKNIPLVGKNLQIEARKLGDDGAKSLMNMFNKNNLSLEQQANILQKFGLELPEGVPVTKQMLENFAKDMSVDAYQEIATRMRFAKDIPAERTVLESLDRLLEGTVSRDRLEDVLKALPPNATYDEIINALDTAGAKIAEFQGLPDDLAKAASEYRNALNITGDATLPAKTAEEIYNEIADDFARTGNKDAVISSLKDRTAQLMQQVGDSLGVATNRQITRDVKEIIARRTPTPSGKTAPTNTALLKKIDEIAFYLGRYARGGGANALADFTIPTSKNAGLQQQLLDAFVAGDADAIGNLYNGANRKVSAEINNILDAIRKDVTTPKNYQPPVGKGFKDATVDETGGGYSKAKWEEDSKSFKEIEDRLRADRKVQQKAATQVRRAAEVAKKRLEKMGKDKVMKPVFSKDIEPAFDGFEFVQDAGGRSVLGKFMGEKVFKYFNTRTLGSESEFVNWLSKRIREADTKRYGNAKRIEGELGRIQSLTRGMREDEVRAVQYVLEGEYPPARNADGSIVKGADKKPVMQTKEQFLSGMDAPRVEALAVSIKKFLDDLGMGDQRAEVLSELRNQYFPHTKKIKPEDVEGLRRTYPNDTKLGTLMGRSQTMSAAMQRKQFQTFAKLDEYLADLDEKIAKQQAKGNADKAEALTKKRKQVEELFERDTLQALAARAYQSVRARAMRDLYQQLELDGMITLNRAEAGKGFRELSYNEINSLGLSSILKTKEDTSIVKALDEADKVSTADEGATALDEAVGEVAATAEAKAVKKKKEPRKRIYMREEVLDGLLKMDRLFTDEGMTKVVGTIGDAMSVWKYAVTVLIPRHYINNFIGNIFNNSIVGVDKQAYKQSADLLAKFTKNPDGLTESEKELIQLGFDSGVIGQGFTADFLRDNPFAVPQNVFQKITKKMDDTTYVRWARKIGEASDDYTRMALFLYTLRNTGSPEIASATVRKYLFNYHELTNADKFVRATMMPFWTWVKNNVPLQMQSILQNPRFYVAVNNMREGTFDDSEDYPRYVKEGYINWNQMGGIRPLSLPMSDINLPFDPLRSIVTSTNPAIKAPFELTANEYMFTGAPIDLEAFKTRSNDFSAQAYYEYILKNSGGFGQAFLSAFPMDENKEGKQVGDVLTALLVGRPYEGNEQK